jgi:murein DD-endopeptidase MepM/ murein hydrolase activator NlpD
MIKLQWPTEYRVITQGFGANPQNYARFGLPGHEGIDMRAPHGSDIMACADGEVYRVHRVDDGHAYGIHVRIRHDGGYKTIYAHLERPLVHVGMQVKAGSLIGLANNTGNSRGSHLHLTLKKEGATEAGTTEHPYDIIDPTPFLVMDEEPELVSIIHVFSDGTVKVMDRV